MWRKTSILFITQALVGGMALISGCGLKAPLSLPTTPEARDRASLPESLLPGQRTPPSSAPAAPGPAPAPR